MEMDVNLSKLSAIELVNISAPSTARMVTGTGTATFNGNLQSGVYSQRHNNNNNKNGSVCTATAVTPASHQPPKTGCCGVLGLLLKSSRNAGRTASNSIGDYNSFGGVALAGGVSHISSISGSMRKTHQRRTPQEVYFESRGKSCKKLLKFNGSSNKILLYPEEGWARTASSSYWTITPCWWQPNRCRIEEFMGASQRRSAKAKMVPLQQKDSLLIAGNFGRSKSKNRKQPPPPLQQQQGQQHQYHRPKEAAHDDEFKLYLSSNISMEDYNMGYCLTGFVERRCQQTNTFQMTHFAVIKRQWPSISNDVKST